MKTIAITAVADAAHRTALKDFLIKENPFATITFEDDVAAALSMTPAYSAVVMGEQAFKSHLNDPSVSKALENARVLSLPSKGELFYEVSDSTASDKKLRLIADLYLSDLMAASGFKRGYFGFNYLKDAVCYCYFASTPLGRFVTKTVYPAVGAMHDVPAVNVERSIRNLILCADRDPRTHKLFRAFLSPSGYPTNSEVIAILLDKLTAYMFHNNYID